MYSTSGTRAGLTFAAVIALASVLMLASAGHPPTDVPPAHSHSVELGLIADHQHLVDGSTTAHPDSFVSVSLPRTVGLTVVALVAVVSLCAVFCSHIVRHAVRGPPPTGGNVGQQLLTRICIDRR